MPDLCISETIFARMIWENISLITFRSKYSIFIPSYSLFALNLSTFSLISIFSLFLSIFCSLFFYEHEIIKHQPNLQNNYLYFSMNYLNFSLILKLQTLLHNLNPFLLL